MTLIAAQSTSAVELSRFSDKLPVEHIIFIGLSFPEFQRIITTYDTWYLRYGMQELLQERQLAKDQVCSFATSRCS